MLTHGVDLTNFFHATLS